MKLVEIILWGKLVGVVVWDEKTQTTAFEYAKEFINSKLQVSPLINPLSSKIVKAKTLGNETQIVFDTHKGLPLFIADSLPDAFGTSVLSKFLEKEGRSYRNLSPVDKLVYIGNRGMGALEFRPSNVTDTASDKLDLAYLNELSKALLNNEPVGNMRHLSNLFHIGTSPGGAQPKILINIDESNGNVYRGDQRPLKNQESWILKFNKDIGNASDMDRGKIEYVYYLMAKLAHIEMMPSELLEFNNEHFFITKRFDRTAGNKIHTQTLHAFAGMDFQLPNTYSYEQVFSVLNSINLDYYYKEQLYRRMVFNVMGRNVDDHTKNFGFSMDQNGTWTLSPAYDLTFTYNENFNRPTPHFLSINGKNSHFNLEDLLQIAGEYAIKNPKRIIDEVNLSIRQWDALARESNIEQKTVDFIASKLNTFPYKLGN